MLEKLFDRSFAAILFMVFFIYSTTYNIGYFGTLGDSLWYFFYIPTSIFDIIKTGLVMIVPLALILLIFKSILINPAFNNIFPSANILLIMAILVLISNLLYLVIFPDSQNKPLILFLEISFYLFSIICFIALIYYFLTEISPQYLLIIFWLSLIPIVYYIGVIDAKISTNITFHQAKSKILLKSNKVVSANILRSFDKGMFIIINNPSSFNFISWDEIKEVKFKKVSSF